MNKDIDYQKKLIMYNNSSIDRNQNNVFDGESPVRNLIENHR